MRPCATRYFSIGEPARAGDQNPRATCARRIGSSVPIRFAAAAAAASRPGASLCQFATRNQRIPNVTDALPISRFPVPDLANMPEDIRNRILAVQEKAGFVPERLSRARAPAGRVPRLLRLSRRADGEAGRTHQGRARDDRRRDLEREPVPVLRRRPRGDPAHPRRRTR